MAGEEETCRISAWKK